MRFLILFFSCFLFGDAITGSHPRVEMTASRLTFLQTQKTNNTVQWQRFKSRCDTLINAFTIAGGSAPTTAKSKTATCAALLSLIDGTLTHSGGTYDGVKYARIAWIVLGDMVPSTTCVNAGNAARDICTGIAIGFDWAYHDQTDSSTEVIAVLSQISNQCDKAIISSNPNVVAGYAFQVSESCFAAHPDYILAQTKYDIARATISARFDSAIASSYMSGGSNGEGLEYGSQTIWLLLRIMDAIETATGEDLSATWNPSWPNDILANIYFWTTPNGRGQTFSYSIPGGTESQTAFPYYEMIPYGDNQNSQNNTPAQRDQGIVPLRYAAAFLVRWYRDHGETVLAENMQYWLNTYSPYWSLSSAGALDSYGNDPWITDFLTFDPTQVATNYNLTRNKCHLILGMNQLLCKDLSNILHIFLTGDGGHIGHSHSDTTQVQIYTNNSWALTEMPGYGTPGVYSASILHSTIMPNGHGSMYDGSISYPGEAATPTSPPGTVIYSEHADYVVGRNNATNAFKFTTAVQVADIDATNGVVRDILGLTSGELVVVLDRVKLNTLAPSVPGPALQIWQCPPVKTILRSTLYNATNLSDWVGQPTPQNGHFYKLTSTGTTASSQPTFNTTLGSTTADGSTAIWTEVTEPCTVSSNNFQVNFISASRTNPVVFQQNTTYGTVIGANPVTFQVQDNRNQTITAVRDVAYPNPLRLQFDKYYSGGIASGTSKTISGYTGACAAINGTWTITVPNQLHTDGRASYATIPLNATGLGLNGCIGQNGIANTTLGNALGYRVRVESSSYANSHTYLTFLQPGPSSNTKYTITPRSGTGTVAGEATSIGKLIAALITVGTTCAGTWTYDTDVTLTHFVFGYPVSTNCYYLASGGTVTVSDSNPGGYILVTTDSTGSFSFTTTSGSPSVLSSFAVTCPTTPVTAGTSQNCVGTAKDQFGATFTSYVGTPTATTGDSAAVIGSTGPFVAGVSPNISYQPKTAGGSYSLTLTDSGATGNSNLITVTPATPVSCTLVGLLTPVSVNTTGSATQTCFDTYNNISPCLGTNTASSDGTGSFPGVYTFSGGETSHNYSGISWDAAGTFYFRITNENGFNCQQSSLVVTPISIGRLKAK